MPKASTTRRSPKHAVWIWAQTWFDAPGKEEPVWGKEQANISFNHFFRGIDIDIRGHAGAIGIRHSGSQGSTMQNVTVYADGAVRQLGDRPMLEVANSNRIVVSQLKAFSPGDFPHLIETRGQEAFAVPSSKTCACSCAKPKTNPNHETAVSSKSSSTRAAGLSITAGVKRRTEG